MIYEILDSRTMVYYTKSRDSSFLDWDSPKFGGTHHFQGDESRDSPFQNPSENPGNLKEKSKKYPLKIMRKSHNFRGAGQQLFSKSVIRGSDHVT